MLRLLRRTARLIRRDGEDTSDVLAAYMAPGRGYERDSVRGVFGPTFAARWQTLLAEVERESADGGTDDEIALRLCPWATAGPDVLPAVLSEQQQHRWITIEEVSELLGVRPARAYQLVAEHRVHRYQAASRESWRLPGRTMAARGTRYRADDVERLREERLRRASVSRTIERAQTAAS